MTCHSKLRDGVVDLAGKYFTPPSPPNVSEKNIIYPGCYVREGKSQIYRSATNNPPERQYDTDQKVYLLICDLWNRGADSIHKMRVMNNDTLSYQKNWPEKFRLTAENEKHGNS